MRVTTNARFISTLNFLRHRLSDRLYPDPLYTQGMAPILVFTVCYTELNEICSPTVKPLFCRFKSIYEDLTSMQLLEGIWCLVTLGTTILDLSLIMICKRSVAKKVTNFHNALYVF